MLENKINLIIDTNPAPSSQKSQLFSESSQHFSIQGSNCLPNLDNFGLVLFTYLCSFISCPPTPQHASCSIREPNALSQTQLTLHAPKPLHMHLFLPEFLFMSFLILILQPVLHPQFFLAQAESAPFLSLWVSWSTQGCGHDSECVLCVSVDQCPAQKCRTNICQLYFRRSKCPRDPRCWTWPDCDYCLSCPRETLYVPQLTPWHIGPTLCPFTLEDFQICLGSLEVNIPPV